MSPVTELRPMADGVLIEFFMNECIGMTGKRLARIESAHADLLECFATHPSPDYPDEADGPSTRTRRVAHSRAIGGSSAAPPAAILDVLPRFLDDPRWHGSDQRDRVVRAALAWSLAQWVAQRLGLRGTEAYESVRSAVWRSRTAVRQAKAEAGRRALEEDGSESSRRLLALFDEIAANRALKTSGSGPGQ